MEIKSKRRANRTKRQLIGLCVLIVIMLMSIGFIEAKYVADISVTNAVELDVATEYTIDKTKFLKALQDLTAKPTALKFVKGSDEEIANLTSLSSDGIQNDTLHSSRIGVFQSADGNTVYIAPMTATGKAAADTDKVIYAPENSDFLFDGNSSYTNLGSNLTSIDCANLDTSRTTSMKGLFYDLTALTSLDISNFNTSKVTDMSYMFIGCSALQSINLASFDTSKVTDMTAMFRKCYALNNLDLSKFDTSEVTTMKLMFGGDQATIDGTLTHYSNQLTTLNISNFDTSKVTDLSYMFYECENLKSIVLPTDFNCEKVETTYAMFFSCKKLTNLDMSNFKTSSALTNAGVMFGSCESLTTLPLSSGFNTSGITNMERMFEYNYELKSLDLSSFNTGAVTSAKDMFNGCRSLQRIKLGVNFKFVGSNSYLPTPSSSYITGAVGNWKDISTEKTYTPTTLATFHNSSTVARTYQVSKNLTYTIDAEKCRYAFGTGATYLKFVKGTEVPSGVSSSKDIQTSGSTGAIGVFKSGNTIYVAPKDEFDYSSVIYTASDCEAMFRDCMCTNIYLTNLDTSKATNMDFMFKNCYATTIDISSFNTSNVTYMRWMFNSCSYLKTIYASSNFVTTKANTAYMFDDSTKLVGGSGTTYNSSYVDGTRAHIDGGTSNPGYFTKK